MRCIVITLSVMCLLLFQIPELSSDAVQGTDHDGLTCTF